MKGSITIPLPTYFTVGIHPLPQQIIDKIENSDGEVCPNLYFLNKRSTTKTSEGLRIVNLGGTLDPAITAGLSKDRFLPFHTEDDAKALRGANSADILLTSHWPLSISSGSHINISDEVQLPPAEQCVADLCSILRPRYHFATSNDLFYEREPFFNLSDEGQPDTTSITRFISLASFNNLSKQKWLYAFSTDPNAAPPSIMPAGTTASPLTNLSKKRHRYPDQSEAYSRFAHGGDNYRPQKRAKGTGKLTMPQECFFCLSNPNLSTHLITSIATDTYLTTAKGPLPTPTTFPSLPIPGHILIIPLAHSSTLATIPDASSRASTYKEMQRYRRSLHSLLIDKSTNGALGAVTWEISRRSGVHVHWQFLPCATDLIKAGLVEAAFRVEAENERFPAFKSKDIGDGGAEPAGGDYFRVWIWRPSTADPNGDKADAANGGECDSGSAEDHGDAESGATTGRETRGKEKQLVLPLEAGMRFDMQFGRRVMAKLLGLENRMDWRACAQTEDEERKDAEGFKAAFRKFDFSLEED